MDAIQHNHKQVKPSALRQKCESKGAVNLGTSTIDKYSHGRGCLGRSAAGPEMHMQCNMVA